MGAAVSTNDLTVSPSLKCNSSSSCDSIAVNVSDDALTVSEVPKETQVRNSLETNQVSLRQDLPIFCLIDNRQYKDICNSITQLMPAIIDSEANWWLAFKAAMGSSVLICCSTTMLSKVHRGRRDTLIRLMDENDKGSDNSCTVMFGDDGGSCFQTMARIADLLGEQFKSANCCTCALSNSCIPFCVWTKSQWLLDRLHQRKCKQGVEFQWKVSLKRIIITNFLADIVRSNLSVLPSIGTTSGSRAGLGGLDRAEAWDRFPVAASNQNIKHNHAESNCFHGRLASTHSARRSVAHSGVAQAVQTVVQDTSELPASEHEKGAETQNAAPYPTDNAERQRDARNAPKAKQKATGLSDAEIKAARCRKKFAQEEHYDDCGSDFEPIIEQKHQTLLSTCWNCISSMVDCNFFDANFGVWESQEILDRPEKILHRDEENVTGDHFVRSYLIGSMVEPDSWPIPQHAKEMPLSELNSYLAQASLAKKLDIM